MLECRHEISIDLSKSVSIVVVKDVFKS